MGEKTPSLSAETEALREAYAALNRNDIAAFVTHFDCRHGCSILLWIRRRPGFRRETMDPPATKEIHQGPPILEHQPGIAHLGPLINSHHEQRVRP